MNNIQTFTNGINITSGGTGTASGDLTVNSNKLDFHNGTTTVPVLTTTSTDTVTNKSVDADNNTLTNIANAAIKSAAAIALNKLAATTASRALVSDGSGFVAAATTTATEIGYVNGVTSAIQTQMDLKAPKASPTFSGTITTPLTASRALATGASSELAASATTATELGYVSGVTSAVQTQLDAKVAKSTLTTKGDLYVATASATVTRQAVGTDTYVLTADSAQTSGVAWAAAPAAPTASVVMYGGATAPTGWLLCDGSAVSRATYATLFGILSTTYGIGDGSTTFNVPDARGVFVRGAGTQTISTIAHTGTRGTTQNDQFQGHHHDSVRGVAQTASGSGSASIQSGASYVGADIVGDPSTDGSNGTPRTGAETRPANITLSYIIKT